MNDPNRDLRYTSQEIAVMAERMRGYEARQAEATARDQLMMGILTRIEGSVSGINTQLAVGTRRMDEIDRHLANTDTMVNNLKKETNDSLAVLRDEVTAINADKRSVTALVTSLLSFLGTAAGIAWVIFSR
jgi:hypothetical protein